MEKVKTFVDILGEALEDKNAVCNLCNKESIVTLESGKHFCKNCEKEIEEKDITYLIR